MSTDLSDPVQARAYGLAIFERHAREILAKGRWNSVLLCVAQYWDDEADDAVHPMLVASRFERPSWPHICPEWDEGEYPESTREGGADQDQACEYCGRDVPYVTGWNDNGWAIAAFEPWCREGATQNDEPADAYLPYAVARQVAGEVRVEVVGKPVRPWLLGLPPVEPTGELAELLLEVYAAPAEDVPRQVLADWLLERGEPRGRFIAEQLAGRDASTLLQGNELDWAGPIAVVCDANATVFRRGFPTEVRVCFRDHEAADLAANVAWTTVERLAWHPDSVIRLPELPVCTAMLNVPAEHLDLVRPVVPQLVELGVRCHSEIAADLRDAPALRVLRLSGSAGDRTQVAWEQLELLEVHSERRHAWLDLALTHGIGTIVIDQGLRITWERERARLTIEPGQVGWASYERRRQIVQDLAAFFHGRGIAVHLHLALGMHEDELRGVFVGPRR